MIQEVFVSEPGNLALVNRMKGNPDPLLVAHQSEDPDLLPFSLFLKRGYDTDLQ